MKNEKVMILRKKKKKNRKKVFVAMSGGVDSSVAAALLKESGEFDVVGTHMICWKSSEDRPPHKNKEMYGGQTFGKTSGKNCLAERDAEDARRVADKLEIPFYVFDFTKEYKDKVFNYMLREYQDGRTPNPDVMCNSHIKFGIFLERALKAGADFIATGHYVRLMRNLQFPISNFQTNFKIQKFENSNIENSLKIQNCKLKIAKDLNKDQSYFLWTLTQKQLKHALFPIGDYEKDEVRELARKFELPTAEKKDSQGLCFVGQVNFANLLQRFIPARYGAVVTSGGERIGEHNGAEFYTIGQRHGLNLGVKNYELGVKGQSDTKPHYVASKNVKTNTVVVAEENDPALFRNKISVRDINWIDGRKPVFPLECQSRIRYRQPTQRCRIVNHKSQITNHKFYKVVFEDSQKAVAIGQSIVFYDGDQMLGGGVIYQS